MKFLTLFFAIFVVSRIFGQYKDNLPKFGVLDKSDILKSGCDYDKEASAEILFDTEEIECFPDGNSVSYRLSRRVRIKIYTEKGLSWGQVQIPYTRGNSQEDIRNLKAITYNLDKSGNIVTSKLDNKAVISRQINLKQAEKVFSFPGLKIGAVLEYSYVETGTLGYGFENWYFQNTIPVRFSRFTIHFPMEIDINCEPQCSLPYSSQLNGEESYITDSYSMADIPAFREEPFMSSPGDYLQRLEIKKYPVNANNDRLNSTEIWSDLVKGLIRNPDFGMQIGLDIPGQRPLEDSFYKILEPYRRMLTIFNYVKGNLEWNGKNSLEAIEGIKATWSTKIGTDGEVNLILLKLCKGAGLDARPILLSTHDHGVINILSPGYEPFNKLMVFVKIGDSGYLLDATDKYTPPGLIPWNVMLSEGILINDIAIAQWEWKFVWDEKQEFKQYIFTNAEIDEKGNLTGSSEVYSYAYCRAFRLKELKKGRGTFVETYFNTDSQALKISGLRIQNEDVDSLPLIQQVDFTKKLADSGKRFYLNTSLFSGLDKNPFIQDKRFSDILFGANQQYDMVCNIKIPQGYEIEKVPSNIRMRMPDSSCLFNRMVDTADATLAMKIELDFRKPLFRDSKYELFREFYHELYELLRDQVVLRKKE